jgi:hypothetical protein
MPLAADLQALRDRALADLTAAHDYYTDTTIAWRLVRRVVAAGTTFTIRSRATGTVTSDADLTDKATRYTTGQLAEATFQQFIGIFEAFLFDLLRLWLAAFPRSLGAKQVPFQDVLDAPNKDAVTLLVVDRELNELTYKRPAAWFAYLEGKVGLGCPAAAEIERIAEAKASRDVLAHGRGLWGRPTN